MHPHLKKIITRNSKNAVIDASIPPTRYQLAKQFRYFRIAVKRLIKDSIYIMLGIAAASFGLESFLLPNKFIDGGATGVALLISDLTPLSFSLVLVVINIPFIILGIKLISKEFALKAALAITTLAIVTATVHFPDVTHDKLLVAIFGGFFLGAGIGLTVRGGGVLDGTEVLAIALSRKLGTTIGDIIMIINIAIFASAAYFLSVETALYSIITYLAASKTLDFIIEGIEEYTGVTIISNYSGKIGKMIVDVMGRGYTVYKGKRGFGKSGYTYDADIIYTVITRLEISKLNAEIEKIDSDAFVVMNSVKDTKGGMIKKRSFSH